MFSLALNFSDSYGASRRSKPPVLASERLMQAIRDSDIDGVQLALTTPGADINYVEEWGDTPLVLASASGNLEIVRKLLDMRGIEVDKTYRKFKPGFSHPQPIPGAAGSKGVDLIWRICIL